MPEPLPLAAEEATKRLASKENNIDEDLSKAPAGLVYVNQGNHMFSKQFRDWAGPKSVEEGS